MMRCWPTLWRRKGKEPKNAVVIASSSKGQSTQSHSLCSGQSEAGVTTITASCPSPSPYFSARIQSLKERQNDFDSKLELEIESSKSHWTELSDATSEEEKLPNSVVFEKLKEHPEWGPFLGREQYKLEIGEKIAEGGQAEIFAASLVRDPLPEGHFYIDDADDAVVLKVFKDCIPLQDLQQSWPPGIASAAFRDHSEIQPGPNYGLCYALGAQLLEDGKFAFIFRKMWGDLRKLIDERMLKRNTAPPFTLNQSCRILRSIALGMAELHRCGLLHKDLKAANVLVPYLNANVNKVGPIAMIGDFDSSVGIVGTGFWRAPEVLLALKNGGSKAVKFTRESDVYSYAMTCYEVITGRLPFEGHPLYDFDVVLRGERPALPDKTPSQLKALVRKCWHQDPLQRPSFEEIGDEITAMADRLNLYIAPWHHV